MKQSQLFSKSSKKLSEAEASKNAQFLIRGGFIDKSSAGVYTLLPMGLRVLEKINAIIREEINAIGGQELLMPTLIQKKYWEKAGRWDVDVIFKTSSSITKEDKQDFEYGLGWTHEEVITAIATRFINSYKDLPKSVYQIQTKFRAEARPQGGLLRGREFSMKDLYSFHESKKDLNEYYEKVIDAYHKIFKRLSLKALLTETGGGAFTTERTHEFQVLNPAGEDTVFYCSKCNFCQNQEIYDPKEHKNCNGQIESARAIEVGNVFRLGTKFSEAYSLNFLNKQGERKPVIMGSYGIGPTRVLGTIAEVFNDEYGLIWPDAVAPFNVHLIGLTGKNSEKIEKAAESLYEKLISLGIEVLYDNRDLSAGEKLNDADLIGIPNRVVISEKTLSKNKLEIKKRNEKGSKLVDEKELLAMLKK
ncbi:MAG: His/Gly/Thr/Pro-type tRNA ligase C-terminal domain-containing protein [Patescibacteria group bacterium]|nr:His/Gly/Thr/Pro-type tRNA ligase C-terminal domain-containing protein [Patescibacteria group bacterium]